MTRHRTFRGLVVTVEENIPTEHGEGCRVTMPDGSQRVCAPTPDHPTLDAAACYAVQNWRVERWREAGGHRAGAI